MAERKLWLDLSDEEIETLAALRVDMGAASNDEVLHMLIRQAHTRAIIVCPACGHSAQWTTQDEARCDSCMSLLHLSDDVWTVIVAR